jgi:hypothetical protein
MNPKIGPHCNGEQHHIYAPIAQLFATVFKPTQSPSSRLLWLLSSTSHDNVPTPHLPLHMLLSGGQMFTTKMGQRDQQIEGITRPQILRCGCEGIDSFDWYIAAWKK